MALVKVWIGAFIAVIVFLGLQSLLQQQTEIIEKTPVVYRA
ncbi:hypothetical protein [Burkholderia multivorans]|nr:hypothetical protein [Burkholderia multivorans]